MARYIDVDTVAFDITGLARISPYDFRGIAFYFLEQLDSMPSADVVEVTRCKDCRWGREVCGNIECFADTNVPPEYHSYEWFCPNGERRTDEIN